MMERTLAYAELAPRTRRFSLPAFLFASPLAALAIPLLLPLVMLFW
jgi:hypothetical protein